MMSLSKKADDLFTEKIKPLMVALQYDRQMAYGILYSEEELFQRAVSLQLYAIASGKILEIDPDTKIVVMKQEPK